MNFIASNKTSFMLISKDNKTIIIPKDHPYLVGYFKCVSYNEKVPFYMETLEMIFLNKFPKNINKIFEHIEVIQPFSIIEHEKTCYKKIFEIANDDFVYEEKIINHIYNIFDLHDVQEIPKVIQKEFINYFITKMTRKEYKRYFEFQNPNKSLYNMKDYIDCEIFQHDFIRGRKSMIANFMSCRNFELVKYITEKIYTPIDSREVLLRLLYIIDFTIVFDYILFIQNAKITFDIILILAVSDHFETNKIEKYMHDKKIAKFIPAKYFPTVDLLTSNNYSFRYIQKYKPGDLSYLKPTLSDLCSEKAIKVLSIFKNLFIAKKYFNFKQKIEHKCERKKSKFAGKDICFYYAFSCSEKLSYICDPDWSGFCEIKKQYSRQLDSHLIDIGFYNSFGLGEFLESVGVTHIELIQWERD